jgi:ABC-type branched-subunit amino acid transport system substrate-binding protein
MCPGDRRAPRKSLLVWLPLWLALAAGCASQTPAPVTHVLVGASLPLSGADADAGTAMRAGYQRAIDEVNAGGGLLLTSTGARVPVTLVVLDDQAETPRAEEHAATLTRDGVHLLLATHTAVRASAQAMVADRAGCPYVTNPTDAPGLPGRRMAWVFSVPAGGQDLQSRAYATATLALATVGRAAALDPAHLRVAFSGM